MISPVIIHYNSILALLLTLLGNMLIIRPYGWVAIPEGRAFVIILSGPLYKKIKEMISHKSMLFLFHFPSL